MNNNRRSHFAVAKTPEGKIRQRAAIINYYSKINNKKNKNIQVKEVSIKTHSNNNQIKK